MEFPVIGQPFAIPNIFKQFYKFIQRRQVRLVDKDGYIDGEPDFLNVQALVAADGLDKTAKYEIRVKE